MTENLAADRLQLDRIDGRLPSSRDEVKFENTQLQQLQTTEAEQELEGFKTIARQRETWQQQLTWEQKRDRELVQAAVQIQADIQLLNTDKNRLDGLINIGRMRFRSAYQAYLSLPAAGRAARSTIRYFNNKRKIKQQQLQQQLDRQTQEFQLMLGKSQAELALVMQQQRELMEILATTGDVTKAIAELQICRQRLGELDRLQVEVLPLQQERVLIEGKIDRETAKIQAKLNELIFQRATG